MMRQQYLVAAVVTTTMMHTIGRKVVAAASWLLTSLGVIPAPPVPVLMLGLDHAGKTTLIHMLMDQRIEVHCTTSFEPYCQDFIAGGVQYHSVDLGGMVQSQRLWSDYQTGALSTELPGRGIAHGLAAAEVLIFVVDAADRDRFPEAAAALRMILEDPLAAQKPVLVLGNKIDRPGAVELHALAEALGLPRRALGHGCDGVPRSWGMGDGVWRVGDWQWAPGRAIAVPRFPLDLDVPHVHGNQLLAALYALPHILQDGRTLDLSTLHRLALSCRTTHSMVQLVLTNLKKIELSKERNPKRPIALYMCSVVKRCGFAQSFEWLGRMSN